MNELKFDELQDVNGGSWKQAGCAALGTIGLAASLPMGIVNPGAGLALAGGSIALFDCVK